MLAETYPPDGTFTGSRRLALSEGHSQEVGEERPDEEVSGPWCNA